MAYQTTLPKRKKTLNQAVPQLSDVTNKLGPVNNNSQNSNPKNNLGTSKTNNQEIGQTVTFNADKSVTVHRQGFEPQTVSAADYRAALGAQGDKQVQRNDINTPVSPEAAKLIAAQQANATPGQVDLANTIGQVPQQTPAQLDAQQQDINSRLQDTGSAQQNAFLQGAALGVGGGAVAGAIGGAGIGAVPGAVIGGLVGGIHGAVTARTTALKANAQEEIAGGFQSFKDSALNMKALIQDAKNDPVGASDAFNNELAKIDAEERRIKFTASTLPSSWSNSQKQLTKIEDFNAPGGNRQRLINAMQQALLTGDVSSLNSIDLNSLNEVNVNG